MMRRRAFIAGLGGAAAWPVVARAQHTKTWTIAYLHAGFGILPVDLPLFETFRDRLGTLGYVEGKKPYSRETVWRRKNDRMSELANDLVALRPDAIVAVGRPSYAIAAPKSHDDHPNYHDRPRPGRFRVREKFGPARREHNWIGRYVFCNASAKSLELVHAMLPYAKKLCVLMSANPTICRFTRS